MPKEVNMCPVSCSYSPLILILFFAVKLKRLFTVQVVLPHITRQLDGCLSLGVLAEMEVRRWREQTEKCNMIICSSKMVDNIKEMGRLYTKQYCCIFFLFIDYQTRQTEVNFCFRNSQLSQFLFLRLIQEKKII